MTDQMITPPVPADVVAQAAKVVESPTVQADLSAVQKLVKADKSSVVAALVHAAVPLTAALGLHLSGQDVAILTSITSTGVSYFVGLNFRTRSKLGK